MPYAFFDEDGMVEIPSRQWRIIGADTALKLADNPNMFIDFGPGSFSDRLAEHKSDGIRRVGFWGVLDSITGYGNATHPIVSEMMARSNLDMKLGKLGFWHTEFLPADVARLMGQVDVDKPRRFPKLELEKRSWNEQAIDHAPIGPRWGIGLTVAPELVKIDSPRKLLYTMCEGDGIPNGSGPNGKGVVPHWQNDKNAWVDFIHNYADILAVPSLEMKRVFEKSLIDTEAHVVPLGTSFDVFRYSPRVSERLPLFAGEGTPRHEKRDMFTIVMDGHLAPRKAPTLSLLELVYPVMEKHEDWRFIIKCRAGERGMLGGIEDDRVKVVAADFSPSQMAMLYQNADVGLCLSLYEGWGMTFREMMATGLPVIVSQTSGHKEDCDPDYNYVVPIKEQEPIHDYYNLKAHRDIPDWDAARAALRSEYEDWKRRGGVQSPMGERAATWIRERRPWSKTVDDLLSLIDQQEGRGKA